MLANKQGSAQQRRSVDALLARFVAPALQLNPSKAIWRPSMTSSGRLYSTGISSLHTRQWSTVLPNHPPPACTFARWHSVAGSRAPGLIYPVIFSCNIPRICLHSDQGLPTLTAVRALWIADAGGGPQWGSRRTELCQRGWERKRQHAAAVCSQEALERSFTAYGEELERVEVFKYLGRLIAYDDADTQAMRSNLRKARG